MDWKQIFGISFLICGAILLTQSYTLFKEIGWGGSITFVVIGISFITIGRLILG